MNFKKENKKILVTKNLEKNNISKKIISQRDRSIMTIPTTILIATLLFMTSCTSNYSGNAHISPGNALIVCKETCGDNICRGCETCETCSDCCKKDCIDSDGGKNLIIAGTMSGISKGAPFSLSDQCTSTDYLMEYYCSEGEEPTNTISNCRSLNTVCKDGACVISD